MILSKYLVAFLPLSALILLTPKARGRSSDSHALSFFCQVNNNIPITVAKNSQGQTQSLFHWNRAKKPINFFTREPIQLNQVQLCQRAANGLNTYVAQGKASSFFILQPTSTKYNLPAVCVTDKYGGCDEILFTIPPQEYDVPITNYDLSWDSRDFLVDILDSKILETPDVVITNKDGTMQAYQVKLFQ